MQKFLQQCACRAVQLLHYGIITYSTQTLNQIQLEANILRKIAGLNHDHSITIKKLMSDSLFDRIFDI